MMIHKEENVYVLIEKLIERIDKLEKDVATLRFMSPVQQWAPPCQSPIVTWSTVSKKEDDA
jgi:hypothetical protein